jgi:hypothetical protein
MEFELMLFYLQSMRNVVAKASGGKDVLDLHEEKTLDWESQQALAIGSKIVDCSFHYTIFHICGNIFSSIVYKILIKNLLLE